MANRPAACAKAARSALDSIARGLPISAVACACAGALLGCAALGDAPRLAYACPAALAFEARLYGDLAILEGLRGHAVLQRVATVEQPSPPAPAPGIRTRAMEPAHATESPERAAEAEAIDARAAELARDPALVYADETVRATFGLGLDGRLVRLDYTGIPEPVYCERAAASGAAAGAPVAPLGTSVRALRRAGPRPPPPFEPDAPVRTNIRTGGGDVGPG